MNRTNNIKKFIHENAFATVVVGFVVAHAGSKFIESVIDGFIMQLLLPMLDGEHWLAHQMVIGPFSFFWGKIVASGLHLVIVMAIVVLIIKILKYEEEKEDL